MAEQKKKTKAPSQIAMQSNMRTYQAETLGMPPLKMVLVHAANDRANAAAETVMKSKRKRVLTQEEAIMKIIEHLTKIQ